MKLLSLPSRTLVPLLLTAFAMLLAVLNNVLQVREYRQLVEYEQSQSLTERLGVEHALLDLHIANDDLPRLRRLVAELGLRPNLTHAYLIAPGGRVVGSLARADVGKPLLDNVIDPPGSGLLDIGGTLFEPPSANGTYSATVDGFAADGQAASAGAFFTDLPSCTTAQDATWVAPNPCSCPGDIDGDGIIGVSDTLDLLANFGCTGVGCTGDVDGDNLVGVADILELLSAFGDSC